MSTIAENIAAIRARIDTAARTTGRTGADITLVAATKMNDAARVREAVAAGTLFRTGHSYLSAEDGCGWETLSQTVRLTVAGKQARPP